MLDRIRLSLGLRAGQSSTPSDLVQWPELGDVLPASPDSDLVSCFEAEVTAVGGNVHRLRSQPEIAALFRQILTDRTAGIVVSRNPWLGQLGLDRVLRDLGMPFTRWQAQPDSRPDGGAEAQYRERCFAAGAGVTGVDFVLAESGTLVLSSLTEGSQLSSLAPPVHIAFYRRDQVVATLEEVLSKLPASPVGTECASGRSIVMITGTSRTADIEQILIRGVHGPRELHAVLVEDPRS